MVRVRNYINILLLGDNSIDAVLSVTILSCYDNSTPYIRFSISYMVDKLLSAKFSYVVLSCFNLFNRKWKLVFLT